MRTLEVSLEVIQLMVSYEESLTPWNNSPFRQLFGEIGTWTRTGMILGCLGPEAKQRRMAWERCFSSKVSAYRDRQEGLEDWRVNKAWRVSSAAKYARVPLSCCRPRATDWPLTSTAVGSYKSRRPLCSTDPVTSSRQTTNYAEASVSIGR